MNEWIRAWATWLQHEKGLGASTRRLYLRIVETLETDLAPVGVPESLSTPDLRDWLIKKGGKPSTWGNRLAALRSFYRYLVVVRKFRLDDPTAPLDGPRRQPQPPQPVKDLAAILASLDALDRLVEGRRVGETRDMATFLAQTGLRVSEACAISINTPAPDRIPVVRRGRNEVVELSPLARRALDALGGRMGIGARAMQRRFERAGFHPDQLRHWHRIHIAQPRLEDPDGVFRGAPGPKHLAERIEDRHLQKDSEPVAPTPANPDDPLRELGRVMQFFERVTATLVREARQRGDSWDQIARALQLPEATVKGRFAT
jgi:integrase